MAKATNRAMSLDASGIEQLLAKVQEFGDGAEDKINEVLWTQGPELTESKIQPLLPVSGRTWNGKPKAAKSTNPWRNEKEQKNLQFVVRSKPNYNYLYFPDDGSNTQHHRGEQHFMQKGLDTVVPEILDLCIANLVKDF